MLPVPATTAQAREPRKTPYLSSCLSSFLTDHRAIGALAIYLSRMHTNKKNEKLLMNTFPFLFLSMDWTSPPPLPSLQSSRLPCLGCFILAKGKVGWSNEGNFLGKSVPKSQKSIYFQEIQLKAIILVHKYNTVQEEDNFLEERRCKVIQIRTGLSPSVQVQWVMEDLEDMLPDNFLGYSKL